MTPAARTLTTSPRATSADRASLRSWLRLWSIQHLREQFIAALLIALALAVLSLPLDPQPAASVSAPATVTGSR